MIDTTAVGKTITALRQQKGMSQQALADMCSVTHQAVSKWENGLALPDIQTLLFLSRHFGVSMEDILSGNLPVQDAEDVQAEAVLSSPVTEAEEHADACREPVLPETTEEDSEQGMDWEQIIAMLPFAGKETADKILLDAVHDPRGEKPDMHIVMSILPFVSRETVETLVTHAMDTMDADMLPALAPFVSTQFLADLVRKNDDLMSGKNAELLQQIIAFLPGDLVDELLRNGAANGLRWKKKGKKGRVSYNLDIDLGSMRKLQNIGKYIGDTVGSVFSNLGASLQSDAPETPPADSSKTERPLMRIARKAVEDENVGWLEDHYCEMSPNDQETLCRLIAEQEKWALIDALELDAGDDASRILLTAAMQKNAYDAITRILEKSATDDATLRMLCSHAAQTKDKKLIRTLAEYADDEDCLHTLLDASIEMNDWELIDLLSENL